MSNNPDNLEKRTKKTDSELKKIKRRMNKIFEKAHPGLKKLDKNNIPKTMSEYLNAHIQLIKTNQEYRKLDEKYNSMTQNTNQNILTQPKPGFIPPCPHRPPYFKTA